MKTILLVEDDPAVQKGIKENLERERFRVLVERDGTRGLLRARREAVDLLILDVMLPGLSGFDLCARLKEEGFPAPIFLLTGLSDEQSKLRGLGMGADDYLPKPFSVAELLLRVRNTVNRTERTLGKAKAFEQELKRAQEIQRKALPARSPRISGLDIFGSMTPATHVGGDYFDYLPLGPDKFALVVADVSGKGMPAALHVHKMQGVVRASQPNVKSAADILLRLQEHLGESMDDATFITAVAAVFYPKEGKVEIASAGHPPVFRKQRGMIYEVPAEGTIVGSAVAPFFHGVLKPATLDLAEGDIFFFYSDGIPEAMNAGKEEFGSDRLKEFLARTRARTSREAASECLRSIRTFAGTEPQSDDATVVAVRVTGKPEQPL